jgi:hypothetical protein
MSKLRTIVLTTAIACPFGALVAGPLRGHPNLQAARVEVDRAWERITVAQKDNEFDMEGHAAKAKEALRLAVDELKLAAEVANKNDK